MHVTEVPRPGAEGSGEGAPRGRRALARAYDLLSGLTLAFVLMAALGLLIAVRALVAQKRVDLREANALVRWLTEVAPQDPGALFWPTIAVMSVFLVNLTLSSVEMAKKALATQRMLLASRSRERIAGGLLQAAMPGPADGADRVERFLRARGWRVRREEIGRETALSGGRRQAGHWTTLGFHLSFYVILVGALLSLLTRFSGAFELAPGEEFDGGRDAYLRKTEEPPLFGGRRGFRLALDRMDLRFWPEGGVRERASWVRIFDAAGAPRGRERLAVNSPISFDGISVYQGSREGFIAGITARDSEGNEAKGTLHFPFPERPGDPMRTRARLPGTALVLAFELRTGMISLLSGSGTADARDALSFLKVYEREGPHERYLGSVVGGAELRFEGIALSFDSLKPFMSFAVVQDRGVPVIFAGLAIGIAALVALYFWVPENCWAVVAPDGEGTRVAIGGASDRYAGSFAASFRGYEEELRRELSKG